MQLVMPLPVGDRDALWPPLTPSLNFQLYDVIVPSAL